MHNGEIIITIAHIGLQTLLVDTRHVIFIWFVIYPRAFGGFLFLVLAPAPAPPPRVVGGGGGGGVGGVWGKMPPY